MKNADANRLAKAIRLLEGSSERASDKTVAVAAKVAFAQCATPFDADPFAGIC